MVGRKIRDETDAKRCLAAITKARGKTLTQWAHDHGIDARSLNAWRVNLGRGRGAPTRRREKKARLVELVPAVSVRSRYLIRCGEMAVEVDEYFDEATLRRVLQVVAGC